MQLPNNPSESLVRLNPHLFAGAERKPPVPQQPGSPAESHISEARASIKLNKLETDFKAYLDARYGWVGVQCITLRLGHDCRYTPDFFTTDQESKLTAWEVKGPMFWDDAKVKLKVAAALYPFIDFVLVRRRNGVWELDIVPR